jgi:hypothetical protein
MEAVMKPGDIVRLVWDRIGSDDDVLLVSIEPETDHNFPRLIEVLWKGVLCDMLENDVEVIA